MGFQTTSKLNPRVDKRASQLVRTLRQMSSPKVDKRPPMWAPKEHQMPIPKVHKHVKREDLRSTMGARRAPLVDFQSEQTRRTRQPALSTNALKNEREESTMNVSHR